MNMVNAEQICFLIIKKLRFVTDSNLINKHLDSVMCDVTKPKHSRTNNLFCSYFVLSVQYLMYLILRTPIF